MSDWGDVLSNFIKALYWFVGAALSIIIGLVIVVVYLLVSR